MIRYASFGRRLWAFVLSLLVDLLVLGALYAYAGDQVGPPFLFWYLIHHVGLVVEGGTLGHRLAGLRVVDARGERPGVVHAVVREIVRVFLSIPPLGLGVLWMLDHPERRTWHDIVGGTVVVRELASDVQGAPEWASDPPWRRRASEPMVEEPAAAGSVPPPSRRMTDRMPPPSGPSNPT